MKLGKRQIGTIIGAAFILAILIAGIYFFTKPGEKAPINSLTLVEATGETPAIYTSSFDSIDNIYSAKKSAAVLKQLENLTDKTSYTLESPLLVYNAFGTNECSYYLSFETDEDVYLAYTIRIDGEESLDFTRVADIQSGDIVTKKHAYQLIGFVPGVQNELILHLYKEDGTLYQEQSFKGLTATVSNNVESEIAVEEGASNAELTDGLYAVFPSNTLKNDEGCDVLFYDANGILRSVYPVKSYRASRIVQVNGNILYATSNRKFALVSPMGQVMRTYTLGDYSYHHDYQYDEETNSLYLLGTYRDDPNHYVEDVIVALDLESGEVKELIDMKDLFPDLYGEATSGYDEDPTDTSAIDWIHINSLTLVGSANEMIFSSRELSAIINITNILTKPEIKYIIADEFILDGYDAAKYLIEKDESQGEFVYQYGQHDVMYVEDSGLGEGSYYLTMYNNNAGWSHSRESLDWSGLDTAGKGLMASTNEGISSYFYKYLVNENTKTFMLVDSIELVYSGIVSNADYVGNNIVTSSGTANQFAEYDADGTLIRQFFCGRKNFNYRVFKYNHL